MNRFFLKVFLNKLFKKLELLGKIVITYLKRKYYIKDLLGEKKLLVIFVPQDDIVNGGILSLNTLYNTIRSSSNIDYHVVACTCTHSSSNYFFKFSKFNNDMIVYSIVDILEHFKNLDSLWFFLPEMLVTKFLTDFEENWSTKNKLYLTKIKKVKLSILNQNDLLMPPSSSLEKLNFYFNGNVSMAVAHKKYATLEKRNEYQMPLHYLSAWVSSTPYVSTDYSRKRNIILISPDDFDRLNLVSKYTKSDLIKHLENNLPNFSVQVIKSLSYNDYRKLISEAKYMITLGEGLDSYFSETILSGGVSFAIYNTIFFQESYKSLETLYENPDDLFENIVHDIIRFDNCEVFNELNTKLLNNTELEYTFDKYKDRVFKYLNDEFDFK